MIPFFTIMPQPLTSGALEVLNLLTPNPHIKKVNTPDSNPPHRKSGSSISMLCIPLPFLFFFFSFIDEMILFVLTGWCLCETGGCVLITQYTIFFFPLSFFFDK
jgi:hypothetical protein